MRLKAQQAGATLIEALASLTIMSLLMAGLISLSLLAFEDTKSQQAAIYQDQLRKAVRQWLGDAVNRDMVASTATTTVPVKVGLAQLAQWLPPNFAAANVYQQTPCVLVYYTPAAERIDAAITTEGGIAIDDAQLKYITVHAGEGAGAIYASEPTVARGASSSWQAPLSTFTSAAPASRCSASPAEAGRLISLVSMDRSGSSLTGGSGEWLARSALAGRPELNRMNTAIDMNGNDVADARDISATRWIASSGGVLTNGDIMTTNGSVYATNGHIVSNDGFLTGVTLPSGAIARLSQGIFYAEVVPNGTAIPKPTNCPSGSPQIFASAVSMSTNPPRSYYAVSLVDASGVSSEWRPTLYLYTSGGWVVGHTAYTNLNVWVKCS